MTDTIKSYLTKIQIGAEQSFKNLSVFPLLSDYFIPFDYLTFDNKINYIYIRGIYWLSHQLQRFTLNHRIDTTWA